MPHRSRIRNLQLNGARPIASAQSNRHRLSRYGDRQLNSAIHSVAMVQMRMPGSAGRAYYDKKRAAGMAPKSGVRCLKRHLSNLLWRIMIADGQRQHTQHTSPNAMAAWPPETPRFPKGLANREAPNAPEHRDRRHRPGARKY
ncbi:transposase [Rhodococcus globerulus]|uniref:transposase n=1 Tax=Rhodococcus globerulus TaxID=33008 RepID=UPI003016F749